MSKGRYDRNRAARAAAAWDSDYVQFGGGFDQRSSPLTVKPGRLVQCLNFEEIYGQQGYQFIKGYERFDGHVPSPSGIGNTYYVVPFTGGNASVPAAGSVVQDATTTVHGILVTSYVTSGSFAAGTAAGFLVLTNTAAGGLMASMFTSGMAIKTSLAVTFATASEDEYLGSIAFDNHKAALMAAREYHRGNIAKVPGEGSVLGGAVFDGRAWVVRNQVGSAAATLWRSSSAGWVSVRTGLAPSVTYRFLSSNFTGDPANIKLFFVNGRQRPTNILKTGTTVTPNPIFGSESTSFSVVAAGLGAKAFTLNETSRSYVAGQSVFMCNPSDFGFNMIGTVTSYVGNVLTVNVTSFTSAGTPSTWDIGLADFSDKPFLACAHKNHLFLAYPSGQVQTSNLGDPITYTSTAALFGCGQEVTGLTSLKGKALAIMCERKIDVITGASSADWSKNEYTEESGAILDTVVGNDGNPILLNARGLTTLAATQNFGDIESRIFSRDVSTILSALRPTVMAARMAYGNNQYRLYSSNGTNLRMTFLSGTSGEVDPRSISPSLSIYAHNPTCIFQGVIDGEERMFFGTSDGYVMEEDVGPSFDGVAIDHAIRLPFNMCKSPGIDKLFQKVEVEGALYGSNVVDFPIYFKALFDSDSGDQKSSGGELDFYSQGAVFDVSAFDSAIFNAPSVGQVEYDLDGGEGRSIGMVLWASNDFVSPMLLQGALIYFNKLGVRQ